MQAQAITCAERKIAVPVNLTQNYAATLHLLLVACCCEEPQQDHSTAHPIQNVVSKLTTFIQQLRVVLQVSAADSALLLPLVAGDYACILQRACNCVKSLAPFVVAALDHEVAIQLWREVFEFANINGIHITAKMENNGIGQTLTNVWSQIRSLAQVPGNDDAKQATRVAVTAVGALLWSHLDDGVSNALLLNALAAASRTITHIPSLVAVVERCLERFISRSCSLTFESWVEISKSLVVPELGIDEYINQCGKDGAALTLFASSVQGMQNKTDGILGRLVSWITQQTQSFSAANEQKILFLVVQIVAIASVGEDRDAVLQVVKVLSTMGEDHHKVTLLRAIGLSSNMSTASARFRVAARVIGISLQLHLQQTLPEGTAPASSQADLQSLTVLASAKAYQDVAEDLVWAHENLSHTPHAEFVHAALLRMYPADRWLHCVCVPPEQQQAQ